MKHERNRLPALISKRAGAALAAAALACWAIAAAAQSSDPLPSRNDRAAKRAIVEFVEALPDTKVGTFSQALMDESKQKGWTVGP